MTLVRGKGRINILCDGISSANPTIIVVGNEKEMTLTGKTVLITGASRGIGAATAQHLAALDANVVLVARSANVLQKIADKKTNIIVISSTLLVFALITKIIVF